MKILLKELRTSRQLSQNKLAQRVGMTLQNLQRIEYGDAKSIPLDTLAKLCQALDCQPGDLLVLVLDDEGKRDSIESQKTSAPERDEEKADRLPSHRSQRIQSFLSVVQDLPESA